MPTKLETRHAALHVQLVAWWAYHVKTHGPARAAAHWKAGVPPCPPGRRPWMPRTWKVRGYDG